MFALKIDRRARLILLLVLGLCQIQSAQALSINELPDPIIGEVDNGTLEPLANGAINFDMGWHFHEGQAEGAEAPDFDDSSWRTLNVPHDFSIEGSYDQNNPTGRGGGYITTGVGWYRKSFTVPSTVNPGDKVWIEFDGIMANATVWLNGHELGHRPFGYVTQRYEISKQLNHNPGAKNVLAVRADNSDQPASRWYAGAGIYRHVRLLSANPVHIAPRGVYVHSTDVSRDAATVVIKTTVANFTAVEQKLQLTSKLGDHDITSSLSVPADGTQDVEQSIKIANPQLWDLDSPHLYQLDSTLSTVDGMLLNQQATPFGIRDFEFKADTGFWINGRNIKIKGVCLHHDGGGVGAAVPLSVWERRLEILRAAGVNAVRVGHTPFAPEFYGLTDRMGFLVLDETFDTWLSAKNNAERGYNQYFNDWWEADTRDVVLRNRNHPSIFAISAGNEIRDDFKRAEVRDRFVAQRDLIHELAPHLPVTLGVFRPNSYGVYTNGTAELMDIVGQNYRERELVAAWKQKNTRKVMGTENKHDLDTWQAMRDNAFLSGQFLWTGIDYGGEANWPAVIATFGLIKTNGLPHPRYFQRMSWWTDEPMVHIARYDEPGPVRASDGRVTGELQSNYTPKHPDTYQTAKIEVYSNCEAVELFLNGESMGIKDMPASGEPARWEFPYAPGSLKAEARKGEKTVATHELQTAGEPAKLVLTTSRESLPHSWDEVAYAFAEVVDANGVTCPWVEVPVTFEVSGSGTLTAVENGNPVSHESYRGNVRKTFEGSANAILHATSAQGEIRITATAPGLESAELTIQAVQ